MDGGIGWPPASGCHPACRASHDMASASRDRVTIALRGIGDSVRAAAAGQCITVSQLARRALVAGVKGGGAAVHAPGSDGQTPDRPVAKLMLRMPRARADALILNAADLGLSYGEYVARLVEGSRLPQPTAEREADRAALLASNDQLATLSADLNALARFLRQGSGEEAQKYRQRLETADAEVRHYLDRASAFLGDAERSKPWSTPLMVSSCSGATASSTRPTGASCPARRR